jgi:O-antigen/teichoic acid export membrane protein
MWLLDRFPVLGWPVADQAVVSAGNFLTSLLVARFLGVDAFGVFSVLWYLLVFMQTIQGAILISPMLTVGPKIEGNATEHYSATQILQILVAFVLALAAMSVVMYAGPTLGIGASSRNLAFPFAGLVAVAQLHEFFRCYCYARELAHLAFRIDLVRYGTQLILFVFLAAHGHFSLPNSLIAISFSIILGITVMFRHIPPLISTRQAVIWAYQRHWNISKWLMPANIISWISNNLFTLLSGALLGPQALGAMRASQNLIGATHVFFLAMDRWGNVRAARIFAEKGMVSLHSFTHRMQLVIGGATACAVLLLALPGSFWLSLLYGAEYKPYAWMVAWYGGVYLIIAVTVPYRYALNAVEKLKPVFIGDALAAVFSACAVYPLLQGYQEIGALLGNFCCQLLSFLAISLSWRVLIKKMIIPVKSGRQ